MKNQITTQNTPIEKLEEMLKSHDWHYQRSDDHNKWKRGSDSHDRIMAFMHKMPNNLKDKAKEVYNLHCPWE